MKIAKYFFQLAVFFAISNFPVIAPAQDMSACRYNAAWISSWKSLIQRQLAVLDKDNAPQLTKIAFDILDGQLTSFVVDMNGRNPNVPLKLAGGDSTLLQLAVAACQVDIAKKLIDMGASVDGNDVATPLVTASEKGEDALVEYLIKKGAQVNKVDQLGKTALEAAVRQRQIGPVRILLKYGSYSNKQFPNGGTILDLVARSSDSTDVEIAQELIKHGAISGLEAQGHVDKQ